MTHLVVFDLDKTIISENCSFAFCLYLVKRKVFPFSFLLRAFFYRIRYALLQITLCDLHQGVFKSCLKGVSLEILQKHAKAFVSSYLPSHWYFPTLFRLRLAQQLGYPVLILSSSPDFLVKEVAYFLHVHLWRGTEYAVDREGLLCHIAKIMEGQEKAVAMQEVAARFSIPLEKTYAYSDSIEDLPLLSAVGSAVAVNPDQKLLSLSLKKGWEIL